MQYIITDWISNVCFDSNDKEFTDIDDASEYLNQCIFEYHQDCTHGDCVCDKCDPEGMNFDEWRGEYSIEEYREGIDRLMWNGQRYVFKPDYYKV